MNKIRHLLFHPESDCYIEVFMESHTIPEAWDEYRECDDVTDEKHHEQKFRDTMLTDQAAYFVTSRAETTFKAWMSLKHNIDKIAGLIQNTEVIITEQDMREWNNMLKDFTKKVDVLKQLTMNSLDKTKWKKDREQYEAELYDQAREGWVKK